MGVRREDQPQVKTRDKYEFTKMNILSFIVSEHLEGFGIFLSFLQLAFHNVIWTYFS